MKKMLKKMLKQMLASSKLAYLSCVHFNNFNKSTNTKFIHQKFWSF